jgi:hypothetical protein
MRAQETTSALSTAFDPLDMQLAGALRSAVSAGTVKSQSLYEAVARYVRDARSRDVPVAEVVTVLDRRARPHLTALPGYLRREFERQLSWWVAQEYHRDD